MCPLLNVCGTLDFVLHCTKVIENVYHQEGGRISVMIKEGTLIIRTVCRIRRVIADFIEQAQVALAPTARFP